MNMFWLFCNPVHSYRNCQHGQTQKGVLERRCSKQMEKLIYEKRMRVGLCNLFLGQRRGWGQISWYCLQLGSSSLFSWTKQLYNFFPEAQVLLDSELNLQNCGLLWKVTYCTEEKPAYRWSSYVQAFSYYLMLSFLFNLCHWLRSCTSALLRHVNLEPYDIFDMVEGQRTITSSGHCLQMSHEIFWFVFFIISTYIPAVRSSLCTLLASTLLLST